MTKKYVAGFIFDLAAQRVLLIKKNKPVWQAGLYNGIGGSIELNESPLDAIIREVKEEVNLSIKTWKNFCELKGEGFSVEFFYTFTNKIPEFKNNTSEIASIFQVKLIPENIVNNIGWLINMALRHEQENASKFVIQEIYEN